MMADGYGLARVGIGGALLVRPQLAEGWIGPVARDADVHGSMRSLAARDLLLGFAVLATRSRPAVQRGALLLCAAADAFDAAVEATDYARTRRRGAGLATVTALGGVAMGVVSACLPRPLPSR
jgi:hypothetical protein